MTVFRRDLTPLYAIKWGNAFLRDVGRFLSSCAQGNFHSCGRGHPKYWPYVCVFLQQYCRLRGWHHHMYSVPDCLHLSLTIIVVPFKQFPWNSIKQTQSEALGQEHFVVEFYASGNSVISWPFRKPFDRTTYGGTLSSQNCCWKERVKTGLTIQLNKKCRVL
jgi:hypothetical protein